MGETNPLSRLDELRLNEGAKGLREYLQNMTVTNPSEAGRLLNDPNLRFATLYLSENLAANSEVFKYLTVRNRNALKLIRLLRERDFSKVEDLLPNYGDAIHTCLKWMLQTGYIDDGLDDDFDEIIDESVILLVQVFNDHSVVPLLTDIIFNRNRQKRYIDDLVWAFFEIHNPEHLLYIADRLKSDHPRDIKLALKLLNFVPSVQNSAYINRSRLYTECVNWIKENAEFLDYTGETFQQANRPIPYQLSYENKYLHKTKKVGETHAESAEEDESHIIDGFSRLNEQAKEVLSDFSCKLYNKDPKAWKEWIRSPLDEQIRIATRRRGRFV
jgi:hypothetical protein